MCAAKQVVLITGANQGIGYEAVKLLSTQLPDAAILLGCRSLEKGHAAVTRMREEQVDGGPGPGFDNVTPLAVDINDSASIERAVRQVQTEHGHLNVLINNGGTSNTPVVKYDTATPYTTQQVMAVNLYGTRDVTNAFLPIMPPHASHIIVVVSEVASFTAAATPSASQALLLSPTLDWPDVAALATDWAAALDGRAHRHEWPSAAASFSAYGPSKALQAAWTRVLAREQPGLRTVVAVTPGLCATALSGFTGRSAAAGAASVVWPVGRWQEVEQDVMYQDGKQLSWCHARVVPAAQKY